MREVLCMLGDQSHRDREYSLLHTSCLYKVKSFVSGHSLQAQCRLQADSEKNAKI